jgi:hypothetical protein
MTPVVIYLVVGLMALVCAGVAVALARMAIPLWKDNVQFQRSGVLVKGQVEHKESKRRYVPDSTGGRHVTEYFVSYRYDYNGQTYKDIMPVTEGNYKAWSEGSSVDVKVLPHNPSRSRLTGDLSVPGFFISLVIGAITLGIAAIALIVIAIVYAH